MSFAARLRVYRPDGDSIGFLTEPSGWSASMPFNDLSALQLRYAKAAQNSGFLASPVEVAIEVSSGGAWKEPRNARYRLVESSANRVDGDANVVEYTLQSYASLMEGIVVIPKAFGSESNYDKDGKRKMLSSSVGKILHDVTNEARRTVPGLAPGLKLGFTATADSNGNPWSNKITIYYDPGTSLYTILDNLASQGNCDWWLEGRTVKVVNPGKGSKTTGIKLFGDATEAPVRSTIGGLLHTAFLVGDSQTWKMENKGGVPKPWGTSMKVITQGGVRDYGTAQELMRAELESGSQERTEYTWSAPIESIVRDGEFPLIDYNVGDSVEFVGKAGSWETMRVHQVSLNFESSLKIQFTLNDRFVDAQVRNAKRQKGIVNGATSDAGTGSVPSRPEHTKPKPKAPEGVVVASEGYWDENGWPKSRVRVGWAPVQQDTNGAVIDISRYNLHIAGFWQGTYDAVGLTATRENLPINTLVWVFVSAVSRDGVQSDWARASVTTKSPSSILEAPTMLSLSVQTGVVYAKWDGKLKGAGNPFLPPPSFTYARIEEAESPDGPWAEVGKLLSAGTITVGHASDVGKPYWYRAVAVDRLGVGSWVGPAAQVTITNDLDDKIKEGLKGASDEIKKIAEEAAAGANAVIVAPAGSSPTKRSNGKPVEDGDVWIATDASGNTLGVYTYLARVSAWVPRKLIADSVLVPGTLGTVSIKDGAITSPKITVDQALVNKIVTSELFAGKITANMLSTDFGINGDGVRIDRNGIRLTSGNSTFQLTKDGFKAITGSETVFNIGKTGHATFKGDVLAGSTIQSPTIKGGQISGSTIKGGQIEGGQVVGAEINTMYTDNVASIALSKQFFYASDASGAIRVTITAQNSSKPGIYLYNFGNNYCGSLNALRLQVGDKKELPGICLEGPVGGGKQPRIEMGNTETGNPWKNYIYIASSDNLTQQAQITLRGDNYWKMGNNEASIQGKGSSIYLYGIRGGSDSRTLSINGSWEVFYSTSARRFKTDVQDVKIPRPEAILDVPLRTWVDKRDIERYKETLAEWSASDASERGPEPRYPNRAIGLIAEEVRDAGFDEYCSYWDGEIDGIQYERLWTVLIPIVRELRARIESLEKEKNGIPY